MKALNEFDTLAEAQAYSYTDERMVSPDMVISLLTQFDCTLSLDSASYTDNKAKGFTMALSGSVTEFNVMNSHPVGQAQQAVLAHLVSISAVTQDFADYLIGYANQVKQPYAAVTQEEFDFYQVEEITLEPTTLQTNYDLKFTETLTQNVNVKIMQRYGSSLDDLTEWHDLANFHNVKYKQNEYQVRIPATTQAIRELKVVADKTINMTITEV